MFKTIVRFTVIGMLGSVSLYAETAVKTKEYKAQHSLKLDAAAKEVDLDFVREAVKTKRYTIIDARGADYLMPGGPMIPGAINIPADADSADILKTIAAKDSGILVYCGGVLCPAGTKLANKLIQLGYTNVHEFPGGIQAWKDAGLTTQAKAEEK